VGVSNLLRWLLQRYEKATLGALLGLLFGAVVGLWPFQQARAPQVGDVIKGQVVSVENASDFEPDDWPVRFFEPTPMESAASIGLVGLGLAATLLIGRLGGDENETE
jgi:putative membrane protein